MLNRHYETELSRLKELAAEFAGANPALAPMLAGPSADPDVERLLEGVAFLNGLTRHKIDDGFPEFVQALVGLLMPQYLRPVPATAMMRFEPRGPIGGTARIPAGTELDSLPVDGTPCHFRTVCDLALDPVRLADARWLDAVGSTPAIRLELALGPAARCAPPRMRLFMAGGYAEGARLLLLLTRHVREVRVRAGGREASIGPDSLRPAGFDFDLLPWPGNAFGGYRVLQEYFVQPEKFLFVDLVGLDRIPLPEHVSTIAIDLELDPDPPWVGNLRASDLMLGVVPAINLFPHSAEPVRHDHRVTDHVLRPEGHKAGHYVPYSVDGVVGRHQGSAQERDYTPFELYPHDAEGAGPSYRTLWRDAVAGYGRELLLAVVDPPAADPRPETLSIAMTCSNGALPESLGLGDISQPTATSPDRVRFENIRPVTPAQDPPLGEGLLWRLVSHLSLNMQPLADAAALRRLLALYAAGERHDPGVPSANRRRIDGVLDLTVTPETRLVGRGTVMRGQLVRVRCREDMFAGLGDLFVFGSVLERFFGDYAGMHAYTRVEVEDQISGRSFQWPARIGPQILL